ncbi:MAG TPA: lysyl oxidase family protein, partial [Labilithrix sp.]|nr:lysyl oxidase family protein [Labilithrix sp.]
GAARNPRYDCTDQGIQVGWQDIYESGLPCQYLDITGLPAGAYKLKVEVNRERAITEMNYDNNISSVTVDIP